MSTSITVRDIDPADNSWLRREARQTGVSMEELVRRPIHEERTKTECRPKPSEAFARYFGEHHGIEFQSPSRLQAERSMTPGCTDYRAAAARAAASVALLLGLLVATGCRQSPLEPDMPGNNVVVVADGRDYGDDPYVANSAAIDGDQLTISVSYAGGCRNHIFTLVISESFLESDPVRLPVVLAHEANGDPCEAYPTESRVFDLALVRTRYRRFYGPGSGKVALRIAGAPGDGLVYRFDVDKPV